MFQEGLKKSEDNRLQKLASKEPAGYDGTTQHVMVGAIEGPIRIGVFFYDQCTIPYYHQPIFNRGINLIS